MTSSLATSPPEPSRLVVRPYRAEDSAGAIALERACAQGSALQLSFRRDTFHRRAENFPHHALFVAADAGQIVGVMAVGVKDAVLHGRPVRASFGFDLRVHPDHRSRGIATRLFERANGWGIAQADIGYSYSVADNHLIGGIARRHGSDAGRYSYLVYPVLRRHADRCSAATAAPIEEVHAEMVRRSGPFDFYCDPLRDGAMRGHQGSWMLRRGAAIAGCSAWSNRGILSEVVERVPLRARLARALSHTPPLDRLDWPRLPAPGDELSSWYLFDFFASDAGVARDLMRHVAFEARAREVDWCHVIHTERDGWVDAVRADVPRVFAPLIPYRLMMLRPDGGPPRRVERLYVDVRDV